MYYAFELKNDMMLSVQLYQRLLQLLQAFDSQQLRIHLPHIDGRFFLDRQRLMEFGDYKIKQAKLFKDFDQGLMRLKQKERDHQLGAENAAPLPAEFDRYVAFYLDQFYRFLCQAMPVGGGASAVQVQNEEKVKEMWAQLTYALARSTTNCMVKTIESLINLFQIVCYLAKSFYEQFLLKKLDFSKLFMPLGDRVAALFRTCQEAIQAGTPVDLEPIKAVFTGGKDSMPAELHILRLEITLLRQISPEFLHYNIFLQQASNNMVQSLVQNTTKEQPTIINNLAKTPLGHKIMLAVPKLILHCEFFRAFLTWDGNQSNNANLTKVLAFLAHWDKLATKNTDNLEQFFASYQYLVTEALPILAAFLKHDIEHSVITSFSPGVQALIFDTESGVSGHLYKPFESAHPLDFEQRQASPIDTDNSLVNFILAGVRYFLDCRLDLDDIDAQAEANADDQSDEDDDDIEMKEDATEEIGAFVEKWNHMTCLFQQWKYEKQSKAWITMQQTAATNQTPMTSFFRQHCRITTELFADLIQIFQHFTQYRICKLGEATLKDLKSLQTFNELLVRHFNEYQQEIQQSLTTAEGDALFTKYKDLLKSQGDLSLGSQKDFAGPRSRSHTKFVLSYLIEMLAQTILHTSPFQLPKLDVSFRLMNTSQQPSFYFTSSKKGQNIPMMLTRMHESLLQLTANGLKKEEEGDSPPKQPYQSFKSLQSSALKAISRIIKLELFQMPEPTRSPMYDTLRLQMKMFGVSFHQSLIHHQQYVNCSSSLLSLATNPRAGAGGGVSTGSEKDRCRRYLSSATAEIALALRFLVDTWKCLIQVQQQDGPDARRDIEAALRAQIIGSWVDKDMWALVQLVLNQIVAILVHRVKTRKYKLRMRQFLAKPSSLSEQLKVKDEKVEHLKATAHGVASLADLLGVLSKPVQDPRVAQMKFDTEQEAITLLDMFRECLLQSKVHTPKVADRAMLSQNQARNLDFNLNIFKTKPGVENLIQQQRQGLNFMLPLICAKYHSSAMRLSNASTEQNQKPFYSEQTKLQMLRRALEIGQANKSIGGVLLTLKLFLKIALNLGIQLRYQNMQAQEKREGQDLIANIVKPCLQDHELKTFIFEALGKSLMSGMRDAHDATQTIQDEQMNQLQAFQQQKADGGFFQEAVVEAETNASVVRAHKLFKEQNRPTDDNLMGGLAQNSDENNLAQIYKQLDFVVNNLSSSNRAFVRCKYQLNVVRGISKEMQWKFNNKPGQEQIKLLVDMLQPFVLQVVNYEETWAGTIYDEFEQKNMLSSMHHQELSGLAMTKLKMSAHFLRLCHEALDFEGPKELYKRELNPMKAVDGGNAMPMIQVDSEIVPSFQAPSAPLKVLFRASLKSFIDTICAHIKDQQAKYRIQRKAAMSSAGSDDKLRQKHRKPYIETFKVTRQGLMATSHNIPSCLREVFELFADCHWKKSFVVQRKQLTDPQRQQVRKAVIDCCSMCGPDSIDDELFSTKTNASLKQKFLDLAKLQDNQAMALTICIQWFADLLDKQVPKGKN
jgi:hypothetical protein